ncbi:hypothetical protein GCM10010303_56680 [Streptomyces purpurascens]|nr:hypothetical protein GCM10010303_56680 [Streptomyces purpurascens]
MARRRRGFRGFRRAGALWLFAQFPAPLEKQGVAARPRYTSAGDFLLAPPGAASPAAMPVLR